MYGVLGRYRDDIQVTCGGFGNDLFGVDLLETCDLVAVAGGLLVVLVG